MKGKNTLELNMATVIEIVQEWLDRRWSNIRSRPEVETVKFNNTLPPTLKVTLKEREQATEEDQDD